MVCLDNENVVDLQIKNNIRGKGHESIYFILATTKGKIANTFAKKGSKVGQRKHGYKRIVELLINNGANVNLTNNAGRTALHEAANWGNFFEAMKFFRTKMERINYYASNFRQRKNR